MYATCCIIIALIVAWTNVKFFEAELKEQDIKVLSKIKELNKNNGEINSSYMNRVEEIILEDDLVIIYDYENNKVIDSINVVVGEQFEDQVHKSIEINSKRIKLDRSKLELHKHTYIHNINLKIDDIPYDKVGNRYLLYYIPRWMVRENYMLTRLLQALTISCFFSAMTLWLFDK
ncbi:MAG: hypothetical protein ACI8WT_004343 [Clostridium sp.]|jgi:hypothetical protein